MKCSAYLCALGEELVGDGAVGEVVLTQRRIENHKGLDRQQQLQQEGALQVAAQSAFNKYFTRGIVRR